MRVEGKGGEVEKNKKRKKSKKNLYICKNIKKGEAIKKIKNC